MANHRSAMKRARQNVKRQARNASIKSRVRSAIRIFREALQGGDKEAVSSALSNATREVRRAASKGILHRNNASRRVSRMEIAAQKAA